MKEEILRLLRSADGYISGQELCNRFGVSRTAVWKAINQLKEAGYEIEAQQNKGYRLMAAPDLMTEAEIKSLMHTEWVAKEVLYFDTIDSTNTKAQELAEKGYPSGTLVVADKQESGKGRRGRSWVSPSGTGIFMTLMIKPDINPNNASMLTLVAALAVAQAITSVTGEEALIKWPNDIMLNSKKVSGMIVESICEEKVEAVIPGIGINVNNSFFVDEIKDKATSLKLETFKEYDEDKLLNDFLEVFFKEYEKFKNGDYSFLDIVRDNFFLLDKEVYLNYYNEDIKGIVKGTDDRGMIIIESNSKLLHLNSGEVTLTHNYSNLNQ